MRAALKTLLVLAAVTMCSHAETVTQTIVYKHADGIDLTFWCAKPTDRRPDDAVFETPKPEGVKGTSHSRIRADA